MRLRRLIIGGGLLAWLALMAVKPVIVTTDQKTGLFLMFRGQSGQIRFINSVTREPVVIGFRVDGKFNKFSVETSPSTEAYYTSGTYSMNKAAAEEATDVLKFCTIQGISLRLGFYNIELADGCLEVRLLWTI
jgi:hypothetical protein